MWKKNSVETPLQALRAGCWFKLICGASYQALPAVRSLTLAYALAGADCVDMAADPAVVAAVKSGLAAARQIAADTNHPLAGTLPSYRRPLLMVSMSAGEDPHFRKAWFDPAVCPAECDRPCERICPAAAIDDTGVVDARCYGCGRCLPVCPLGLIAARSQPTPLDAIAQQTLTQVEALEIHTQVGQFSEFQKLWQTIRPWVAHLQVISISCPDGEGLIDYLKALQRLMSLRALGIDLIWQTDGRPMSGDIGKGTTHAAVRLAQKVLAADLRGHIQLAGGTNQYTVLKLRELGLWRPSNPRSIGPSMVAPFISGIAYGSYARRLLMTEIEQTHYLEEDPRALKAAVALARSLVMPVKQANEETIKPAARS
ncbi:MAG: LdpA C-terminal domain-containing domain [Cyanobacteria bacterium J06623_5]